MYISLNWIKDFVDLDGLEIEEIANKEKLQINEILLMTVDVAGNHTIIRKDSQ